MGKGGVSLHLDSLGLTWTQLVSLDSLGVTWTHLVSLGLTWSHLVSLGLTWTHLVSLGLTWSLLDPLGLSWTHLEPRTSATNRGGGPDERDERRRANKTGPRSLKPRQNLAGVSRTCTGGTREAPRSRRTTFQIISSTFNCTKPQGHAPSPEPAEDYSHSRPQPQGHARRNH